MTGEFDLEFRSHGDIEYECIRSILFHINRLLLLRRQGLTQHLYFVFLHVLIDFLANQLVNFVNLHAGSYLTLNQSHRYLTRTETGNVGFLTIVLQCLLDILFEVCFLHSDGHQTIHFVGILECYFHLVLYLINC